MQIDITEDPNGQLIVQTPWGTSHPSRGQVAELVDTCSAFFQRFNDGGRPLADPMELIALGEAVQSTLFGNFGDQLRKAAADPKNRDGLVIRSAAPRWLSLPWELLPDGQGSYLSIGHPHALGIRRAPLQTFPAAAVTSPAARPLRVLFVTAAPRELTALDFEREEEAILRIADRQRGKMHLDFGEAGTFDELRDLILEHSPHVVHLSGHGSLDGESGTGRFSFEDERGGHDSRPATEMADRLFAGHGVRLAFVSACRSSQPAAAGICQALTATGAVPVALGWGASIADDWATEFAIEFYRELAAGRSIDGALTAGRRELLTRGRHRRDGRDWLDASFALPQLYAAEPLNQLIDERLPEDRPRRVGVRYQILADNIRGLKEGFVGRRRVIQSTRPPLRDGDFHVLLLTGIGGAGKSTLATRLANRLHQDGFHLVALRAQRDDPTPFSIRLLDEIATACAQLPEGSLRERLLRDTNRPMPERLRLAVDALNAFRILLVLDNLESLMPEPPGPTRWEDANFESFFDSLCRYLTGEGRALLTCRFVPEACDLTSPNLHHAALPDFGEADFFKYLARREGVANRIGTGELPRGLLAQFQRKLGATPRFLEQAVAVLATIDPDELRDELDGIAEGQVAETQQAYFSDLFLPQLYAALPPAHQIALSRLAVVELSLPLDGIAAVAGLTPDDASVALAAWIAHSLAQPLDETTATPRWGVYPLQRAFLTHGDLLAEDEARSAHRAAAAFFRGCFEQDREAELGISFMEELAAYFHHAGAAGDRHLLHWAAILISRQLYRRAEFRAAVDLLEPLHVSEAGPDLDKALGDSYESLSQWPKARLLYDSALAKYNNGGDKAGEAATRHNLASIDLNEGNYPQAREQFQQALAIRQSIGDKAGEAATRHQLASIEVHEGNHPQAREQFQQALAIRQSIGDKAGEAATLYQIGIVAWKSGLRRIGIQLVALCFLIEKAIGSGGLRETTPTLVDMAAELGLTEADLEGTLKLATQAYASDRGAQWVREAFEGI